MFNHIIELQKEHGQFQEACDQAASVGLLEEALSLVRDRRAVLQYPVLEAVIDHIHAGRLLSEKPKPATHPNWKGKRERPSAQTFHSTGPGNLLPPEQKWKLMATYLHRYLQRGEIVALAQLPEGTMRNFFVLLVSLYYCADEYIC